MAHSRRSFLQAGAFAGGGFILSLELPVLASSPPAAEAGAVFAPNAFVAISSNGKVTVTVPVVEMGQGTYTSVPMLIAEELGVSLEDVSAVHAPVGKAYGNPALGDQQVTGASSSTRGLYLPMRKAGAAARMMLMAAAAQTWNVGIDECEASNGSVLHKSTGRTLRYGVLAAKAARFPVPTDVVLKDSRQFALIGKSARRLDSAGKVDGSALFGIDVKVPGMKLAGVVACPVFGGKLARVDDRRARSINGVRQIIALDDAVAVVGDHMGAVRKGLAALRIDWDEGPHANFSTAKWSEQLKQAVRRKGEIAVDTGEAAKVIAQAPTKLAAAYEAPALAHATMEPMNCTVRLAPDACEVWTGTQAPAKVQARVARLTGLQSKQVTVHNCMLGGGFGRRLEADYVEQAVRIAQRAQVPIKLIWSREEDMRHDYYRPHFYHELQAAFDAHGRPLAFSHRLAGSSVTGDAAEAAAGPYDFPAKYVEYVPSESPVPAGYFRGVGVNHNTTAIEGYMDELAHHLGRDPFEFRRGLLVQNPRARVVLETAANGIGWGRTLERGRGLGIAVVASWESFMALALEVAVDGGSVKLARIVAAIDCGQLINPDGVEAQVQSGVIFGLTAALYGRITVENGRVVQSNFHDYPIMRMHEVPPFDVHLIPSSEKPGGVGEIGATLPAAALLNAIHAATGVRLRSLPADTTQLASPAAAGPHATSSAT